MSLFYRLLVNALFIYGAKIFEAVLQLAVLSFVLSRMEKEYYAAALLIVSIQATIDLARGGMQKATLKYIAEYKAKSDLIGVNGILSSSSAMQGAVGLVGLIVCLFIAPYGTTIFSLPNYMQYEAQWGTILLGFGIAISFAISPWHNSVAAQERYDLLSVATVCGKFFRAVLIVILLFTKAPPLISLVIASVSGGIVERLVCMFFVKRISPELIFSIKHVGLRYINVLLGFSLFDLFHTLSGLLYSQGSLYLAAHLISLDAVAALGIIGNITGLIGLVTSQIAQMLVPVASRLNTQGSNEKLKDLVVRGTTITVFSGGIIMTGIIPWLQSILIVWLGSTYAHLAVPAMVLITATFLMNSITCIHNSLGGIGKVAVDGISSAVCTVLGLSIGAGLIYWVDYALLGLTIGLLCTRLSRFLFVNWYGSRVFNFSIVSIFWKAYLRTFLMVFTVCLVGFHTGLCFNSWPPLIMAGIITSCSYFCLAVFLTIDAIDRYRFAQALIAGVTYLKNKINHQEI